MPRRASFPLAILCALIAAPAIAADTVVTPNLIVPGAECVGGAGCVAGETFDAITSLKLKGPQVGIYFDDTTPGRDWRIQVNGSSSDFFAITDENAGASPLFIDGGTQGTLLHLFADDRVEIGSNGAGNPNKLTLFADDSPALLFRQTGDPEGGPVPYGWDLRGNQLRFVLFDATAATTPLAVTAGAGLVGLGITMPAKQLHVKGASAGVGAANTTALRVENTAATIGTRRMVELFNNGNAAVTFVDSATPAASWALQNSGTDFTVVRTNTVPLRVSELGDLRLRNGANPYHFQMLSNGNLTITGVLTQGSDVNSKKDIVALDGREVLARLDAVPIAAWTYKADGSNARHVGPMAQDFHEAFGLGEDDTHLAPGDLAGVALAGVKALDARLAEKDAQLAERDARIERLERAVEALRAQVEAAR
jgi:hypothetical protein